MKRWERVTGNLRAARGAVEAHRRECVRCKYGPGGDDEAAFPCLTLEDLTDKVRRRRADVQRAREERR